MKIEVFLVIILGIVCLGASARLLAWLLYDPHSDEPIDVEPDITAADIILGVSLGIFGICVIGGVLFTACYVSGYF